MLACVTLTDSVSKLTDSQILQIQNHLHICESSRICEIFCVYKSLPEISEKITLFFDVAKRPTFSQPQIYQSYVTTTYKDYF